ncbi:hypothetical protein UlMin_005527 [Ulmus minor]
MASSLHQWESDPLFSAAEVVQDSADRMESIFRALLHELSLVQSDHSDPKLLASIDFHRRDLATILETTKWQLEDFQRAVSLSVIVEKSQMKEDVISRHKQFIQAIREQIIHVEESLTETSMGNSMRNKERVYLNEEDRDGFALFLSGGGSSQPLECHEVGDSGLLRRFLNSTTTTSAKDTSHSVEHKSAEFETLNINGHEHMDHKLDSRENNLRKAGSYSATPLGIQAVTSLPEISRNRYGDDGSWDLESNEAKPKNIFHENKLRGFRSRTNLYGFFNNPWTAYWSRVSRNYTKKLKDGEEQRHSPSATSVPNHDQSWLGTWRARYQRAPYYVQLNRHSIQLISFIIFALIILGKKYFFYKIFLTFAVFLVLQI